MFTGLDALAVDGGVADFAAANGLQYKRRARPPALSGGPYEQFTSAKVRGSVSGPGWLVGNLDVGDGIQRVRTPSGATIASSNSGFARTLPPIGYLALTLPRHLPNMILDSKGNDPLFGSSLVHPPEEDQRLGLEGDFDQYFDLYAPSGYETDALYIFTPDLMALMIDNTAQYDVEIRGNQLLVYAPGGFDLALPATWLWIDRVVTVIAAKAFSRADGYSDSRLGVSTTTQRNVELNRVAPAGERLRRRLRPDEVASTGLSTVAVVAFIAIGAMVLLGLFATVLIGVLTLVL